MPVTIDEEDLARPCSEYRPMNFNALVIVAESTYFVNMSAGLSVPSTLNFNIFVADFILDPEVLDI